MSMLSSSGLTFLQPPKTHGYKKIYIPSYGNQKANLCQLMAILHQEGLNWVQT